MQETEIYVASHSKIILIGWYDIPRTIFKFCRLNTGGSHADNTHIPCFISSVAYWALELFYQTNDNITLP